MLLVSRCLRILLFLFLFLLDRVGEIISWVRKFSRISSHVDALESR